MNVSQLDEEAIFYVARRIEGREARDAYLRQVCGDDAALRDRIEALLQVCEQEASFLESSPYDATVDAPAVSERAGAVVGPYKLLEQIGEGGMGVVFMAEQTHPVRRRVALKVIKPGMDSRQVIARFEAERQALALMDHPNIAKVLDAGATDSGRPYFVMELVKGIPITDFCDKSCLSIPERLDLFVLVCRAVQHAHQKGVIHRDLKPTNVLVTLIDGAAVPKVIDFGVAKATGASLTERSLFTGFAQLVGTPLYMSPEQAELSGVDVDTRSDIYALGVLLYELLTGTTPIDRDALCKAAYDEVRRLIREQETPTPSTRLGTLGATLAAVSANRLADSRGLSRSVRGELDWIVMKALEKDRRRRYETANDFAADVMRHLTDKPVEACPPSASYRLRKYARRNRAALMTAGLVALALCSGVVVSTWQAIRATRAEGRIAAALATAEERSAQARRAVDEMYTEVAEKWLSREGPLTPLQRQFLEKALAFYEEFLADQGKDPKTRQEAAEAATRVGKIRARLGLFDRALEGDRQALGLYQGLRAEFPDRPEYRRGLAAVHHEMSEHLADLSRMSEAEEAARKAVELVETLVADFPSVAEDRRALPMALRSLGVINGRTDRWDQSTRAFQRAIEIVEKLVSDFPDEPRYRADLAAVLTSHGEMLDHGTIGGALRKYDEAEELFRRAIGVYERVAAQDPTDADHRTGLARGHYLLSNVRSRPGRLLPGRFEAMRRAQEIQEKLVAEYSDRPRYRESLVATLCLHANELYDLGRYDESEPINRRALSEAETLVIQFPDVPDYCHRWAATIETRGKLLAARGQPREALEAFEKAVVLRQKVVADYPNHTIFLHYLAHLWKEMVIFHALCPDPAYRNADRAVELARKAVELRPRISYHWKYLAMAQCRAGNWDAAIKAIEKDFKLRGHSGYSYHWTILAIAHARRGEMDRAREWFSKLPPTFEPGAMADTPRVLYEEAAALLGEKKPSADSKAERPTAGAVPK